MSMHIFPDGKYGEAAEATYNEIQRAISKHPSSVPFRSTHEAYAVLLEEVDEMWAEVKANNTELAVYEAVQVAAMAIRFIAEFGKYPYSKPKTIPVTNDRIRLRELIDKGIAEFRDSDECLPTKTNDRLIDEVFPELKVS